MSNIEAKNLGSMTLEEVEQNATKRAGEVLEEVRRLERAALKTVDPNSMFHAPGQCQQHTSTDAN